MASRRDLFPHEDTAAVREIHLNDVGRAERGQAGEVGQRVEPLARRDRQTRVLRLTSARRSRHSGWTGSSHHAGWNRSSRPVEIAVVLGADRECARGTRSSAPTCRTDRVADRRHRARRPHRSALGSGPSTPSRTGRTSGPGNLERRPPERARRTPRALRLCRTSRCA